MKYKILSNITNSKSNFKICEHKYFFYLARSIAHLLESVVRIYNE